MPNLSTVNLIGHLARDAETKDVGSTTVTEFTIATNHKRKDEETVMWFRCAFWGVRGAKVEPYLEKGKAVYVQGGFHVREYEKKDGSTGYSLEVNVSELALLGGGGGGQSGGSREFATPQSESDRIRDLAKEQGLTDPGRPAEDDDIPF